jgi:hypothetical protein
MASSCCCILSIAIKSSAPSQDATLDREEVKVHCKSSGDHMEGVAVVVLHICLHGQHFCMHGVLLMAPLGQRGGSRGLYQLGALSGLSVLRKALLVERDHHFVDDCIIIGQGKGSGNTAYVLRGGQWIVILDGPLLDRMSDYGKCNNYFLYYLNFYA